MNIAREIKSMTLIEWMIVIAIVGILAAVAVPAFFPSQHMIEKRELRKQLKTECQNGVLFKYDAEWSKWEALVGPDGQIARCKE